MNFSKIALSISVVLMIQLMFVVNQTQQAEDNSNVNHESRVSLFFLNLFKNKILNLLNLI
jgi:hypothetical protein